MVQVVQAGQSKIIVCKDCSSTLSYQLTEVKSGHSTDYLGDRSDYKYISCPQCKNKVLVN